MDKVKKLTTQKGITLVALIITIIVLLILAIVTIRAVQGDGIIKHAKNAKTATIVGQEKEQIQLAVNEWKIQKNYQKNSEVTFKSFMTDKLTDIATIPTSDPDDGPLTVTMKDTGNIYVVTEDGAITSTKGMVLSTSKITLELNEGTAVTQTLTARLNGIEGKITWSIPEADKSIATISATTGESITVTAVAKGSTTITATCGSYTASCAVTVREPVNISKGSFVEYNVAYTDAYKSYEYTSTNGWRLLDYTDNGDGTLSNVKLISTGIPAKLYYYINDTTNSSWYVTDNTQLTNFRNKLTNNGKEDYTFYTGEDTYYALQASAGMYYNFGNIEFAYGTSNREKSLGYFTKITSNGTTYDSTNTTETTGTNLFVPSGVNASVRLLTLPEMNKMLGRTEIDSTNKMSDPTGASGLFVLQNLKNVKGMIDNTYDSGYYWLASPYPISGGNNYVCYVGSSGYVYYNDIDISLGVRPVVCLTSNIQLLDTNGDGVLEIQ